MLTAIAGQTAYRLQPFYADDFNRADEALATSADWTQLAGVGSATVIGNRLRHPTGSDVVYEYTPAILPTNQYVHVEISTVVGGNNGVLGRLTDTNNYYMFRHSSAMFELYKRVAGTFTLLDSIAQTPVGGDVMRLECSGTSIVGKVNGATVCSAVDSDLGGTGVGLRFNSSGTTSFWDNFECGVLS